jgi:hypothetical protein
MKKFFMTIMMKINIGKIDIIMRRVLSGALFLYYLQDLKLNALN